MSSDQKDLLLNGKPLDLILDVLRDSYEREWTRKSNLEGKITNNITVSGLVVTLLFGFVAFVFPSANAVPHLDVIMFIILLSIILEVFCLILSIYAFKLQDYQFIFANINSNRLKTFKTSRPIKLINTLIDDYYGAVVKNAEKNDDKVDFINIAQGFLLAGIILIPVPVGIMLFS